MKDYLAVFAEDMRQHSQDITDTLVRGGDPEALTAYEDLYDPALEADEVDTHIVTEMLVALHKSGDVRAHDRLVELVREPDDAWLLITGLEDMGFEEEALALARKEFALDPDYNTGVMVLNLAYNARAMEAVQFGVSKFDTDLITIIHSRAKHLGKLATHINKLEGTTKE